MSLNLAQSSGNNRSGRAATDLNHELRTPLAVIRMQAQMLIRSTKRGGITDPDERARFLSGLQRIDDAVSKLTGVMEAFGTDRPDDHRTVSRFP
jgi:signal transduction histidine kinase